MLHVTQGSRDFLGRDATFVERNLGPGSSTLVQMLPHFLAWVSVSITAWLERHPDNITVFPLFVTIMEVSKDELEVEPKDQLRDPKVDPDDENPEDTLHDWNDAGDRV